MKQKIENMTAYLDAAIARCTEQEKALVADERKDEAIFEKIRANVYNIYRTILGVAVQNCGGDADKMREFFMKQIKSAARVESRRYMSSLVRKLIQIQAVNR